MPEDCGLTDLQVSSSPGRRPLSSVGQHRRNTVGNQIRVVNHSWCLLLSRYSCLSQASLCRVRDCVCRISQTFNSLLAEQLAGFFQAYGEELESGRLTCSFQFSGVSCGRLLRTQPASAGGWRDPRQGASRPHQQDPLLLLASCPYQVLPQLTFSLTKE